MKRSKTFIRLTEWEHWPIFLFYFPLIPFFVRKILSAPHPLYFLNTNPGIHLSGIGTESKFESLLKIPEQYRPKGILIKKKTAFNEIQNALKKAEIRFPIIAKPDIGFRGYRVKKIDNAEILRTYFERVEESIILQEFIPYTRELGIFYHRLPGEAKGRITSVTVKEFSTVTGNGKDTLEKLILEDERAFLYDDLFREIQGENYNIVYPKGEKITLSVIGNHSKGSRFINGNHLIDEKLTGLIDRIAKQIDGWYYGRIDIKYRDYDTFLSGNDFKILELNGIISEPTHIYDASYPGASFSKAVKAIRKHWEFLDQIAKQNSLQNRNFISFKSFIREMKWLRNYSGKLRKLSN